MNKIELVKGQKVKVKLQLLYGDIWKDQYFDGTYISCWENMTDKCWMYNVDLGKERGRCSVMDIIPIGKILQKEISVDGNKYILKSLSINK